MVPNPPVPLVIFISTFDVGGTERQMVELASRLNPARFAVHIACFRATGSLRSTVERAGLPVAEFPIRGGFFNRRSWHEARRFASWCRVNRIQILQTSDYYTNVFGLTAGALARVPVRVGGRRGLNVGKSSAHLALQRVAFAFAHRVVANSRAAWAQTRREYFPARRISSIGNGLHVGPPPASGLRAGRRVITVANLRPEKAHGALVDAAALLRDALPDVEFVFVGEGPMRAAISERIRAARLDGTVHLLGERDDVPALLAEADVFALPSRSEAFPNAVLEAMAAGLPVVATAAGGLGELVHHEKTGLRVPPDDPAALANAIRRLIADPGLAAALGSNARRFVQARYSFERMVEEFENLYEALLARRTPRSASNADATIERGYAHSVGEGGKAAAG